MIHLSWLEQLTATTFVKIEFLDLFLRLAAVDHLLVSPPVQECQNKKALSVEETLSLLLVNLMILKLFVENLMLEFRY